MQHFVAVLTLRRNIGNNHLPLEKAFEGGFREQFVVCDQVFEQLRTVVLKADLDVFGVDLKHLLTKEGTDIPAAGHFLNDLTHLLDLLPRNLPANRDQLSEGWPRKSKLAESPADQSSFLLLFAFDNGHSVVDTEEKPQLQNASSQHGRGLRMGKESFDDLKDGRRRELALFGKVLGELNKKVRLGVVEGINEFPHHWFFLY